MAGSSTASGPAFYLDLSSPEAWLSAERILALLPVPCEWVPVRMPFEGGFRCAEDEDIFRMEIERAAPRRGDGGRPRTRRRLHPGVLDGRRGPPRRRRARPPCRHFSGALTFRIGMKPIVALL